MLGSCAHAPVGRWLKAALGKMKRFRLSAAVGEVASGGKGSFLRYDAGLWGQHTGQVRCANQRDCEWSAVSLPGLKV